MADTLYVRQIAEKFLIVRDTAAQKEFDFARQMAPEHILVQRSKKIEMDEKRSFKQRHIFVYIYTQIYIYIYIYIYI